ncbi:hypothetical protein BY996DRAFT_3608871 [Phakopsora pachyrhizi]|nr:hypothetical protein BY996DRAFT_3608871 [Phakopsora pachyrhizi]
MRTLRFVGFTVPSQPKIFIKKLVEPLILTMILFSGPIYTDLILPITTTGIRKIDIKYQNNQKSINRENDDGDNDNYKGENRREDSDEVEKENFMDLIFMKVDIYVMRNLVFGPFLEEVVFRGFQFGYTTVFGWYASFIYLRTGSIIATAMCHSFCNYMGFPGILGALKKFPDHRNSIKVIYLIGVFG